MDVVMQPIRASRFHDRHLLFGAALAQLVSHGRPVTIHERPDGDNSLFDIRSGAISSLVLLKYATRAKSPWYFTLTEDQLALLSAVHLHYAMERRFMALVCHLDGVCLLSLAQFNQLVQPGSDAVGWGISISRPPRGQYRVCGPARRRLDVAIARSRWVAEILDGRT
jgi:hypothetical protein